MADFEINISQWCDKAGEDIAKFVVAFALRMTAEIKAKTPVLTGRLRASIQPMQELSTWQAGDPIVIGTNVEYARRIEYGFVGQDALGRHYDQKGVGMFTATINDAAQIANEVLRGLQG